MSATNVRSPPVLPFICPWPSMAHEYRQGANFDARYNLAAETTSLLPFWVRTSRQSILFGADSLFVFSLERCNRLFAFRIDLIPSSFFRQRHTITRKGGYTIPVSWNMQPASFSYRFLDSYDAPYEFIRIESRDNVNQRHSTFVLCNEKVG